MWYIEKHCSYSHIRRRITSADGPLTRGNSDAEEARRTACADGICIKDGQGRQRAKPFYPKAGVAACLAMIPPALKKQPVQPQPQAMGAARRDPRRGESPVGRCQAPVRSAARQSGKSCRIGLSKSKSNFTLKPVKNLKGFYSTAGASGFCGTVQRASARCEDASASVFLMTEWNQKSVSETARAALYECLANCCQPTTERPSFFIPNGRMPAIFDDDCCSSGEKPEINEWRLYDESEC